MTGDSRKSLDGTALGLMAVPCLVWSFQQVVLKAVAHEIAPLTQIALRSGVAAPGLHWRLPAERLAPVQWLGIGLAFGGIAVAFLGRDDPRGAGLSAAGMPWGDLLGLLAGAARGATTVAIRCSSLAGAALVLAGIVLVNGHDRVAGLLADSRSRTVARGD